MNNAMKYNGYTARIGYDPRDNAFVGQVLGIADNITFHGRTVSELTNALHLAIDHYLEDCKATGRCPQKPASGKLMLRIPPDLHAAATIAAQTAGKSLNQWVTEVLKEATHY